MSNDVSISNFAAHEFDIIDIWDRMQRSQTDFCIGLELPAYYSSPQWHEAREVLDLGTGNGYYLQKIADRFPTKAYVGVDISDPLIRTADRENRHPNISFSCTDVFETEGLYNFVIVRLLLQHLPDPDAMLKKLSTMVMQGGSALVIDAHDAARLYYPQLPVFMDFFDTYVRYQASQGLDRTVAARLRDIVERHPEWNVGAASEVVIPSTLPENLDLFRETYRLFIDLVERGSDMKYDYAAVRREWDWWSNLETCYTQAGLNIVRLDRL